MNQPRILGKIIPRTPQVDWEAIYQRELPRLYNFFRYRFGDDHVAEDLTSETFEKAWRNRQRYRHDLAAFSTWLLKIARNVAIDYYRKLPDDVPLDKEIVPEIDESMDSLIQQHSDYERLSNLLERLKDRDRDLVALKYGAQLTNRSIASLTGITESNVGTILHRILQHLRAGWEEDHE
jgi:RNA polymerase sigma-70 factor (ECF subfamily)